MKKVKKSSSAGTENDSSTNAEDLQVCQPNAKHNVRRCCHLECESDATHSIYYSEKYEDYSDFCAGHLHQYLPNNYSVNVSPIMSDGNNA